MRAYDSFHSNHLETAEFNRFQYVAESGSGPGGRRFKSSLPDHYQTKNFLATYSVGESLPKYSMNRKL
jgi:hypothetical protein